jgi:hypothetical protein
LLSKRQNGQQQENEAELLVIRRPGCGWMRRPAAELSEQPQKGNSGSIVCLFFPSLYEEAFVAASPLPSCDELSTTPRCALLEQLQTDKQSLL